MHKCINISRENSRNFIRIHTFFLTLMSDVWTFREKTIETASPEIKETQKELNNKLQNAEREEVNAT